MSAAAEFTIAARAFCTGPRLSQLGRMARAATTDVPVPIPPTAVVGYHGRHARARGSLLSGGGTPMYCSETRRGPTGHDRSLLAMLRS